MRFVVTGGRWYERSRVLTRRAEFVSHRYVASGRISLVLFGLFWWAVRRHSAGEGCCRLAGAWEGDKGAGGRRASEAKRS